MKFAGNRYRKDLLDKPFAGFKPNPDPYFPNAKQASSLSFLT